MMATADKNLLIANYKADLEKTYNSLIDPNGGNPFRQM